MVLEKVSTEDNPVDMATKALSTTKFKHCLQLLQGVECEIKANVENCDRMALILGSIAT